MFFREFKGFNDISHAVRSLRGVWCVSFWIVIPEPARILRFPRHPHPAILEMTIHIEKEGFGWDDSPLGAGP